MVWNTLGGTLKENTVDEYVIMSGNKERVGGYGRKIFSIQKSEKMRIVKC